MHDYIPEKLVPLSDYEISMSSGIKDLDALYGLPKDVIFCTRCVISNQRPRITFNDDGVCSACTYWEKKDVVISWAEREDELRDLCDRYRKSDGSFDVLVPSSGGKDSIFVAHQLKNRFGMHPLTMTWSPHVYTDIGLFNFFAQIHAGLDNILLSPNAIVHRRMCRIATLVMGDPFQPFIYGQSTVPLRIAANFGISLIMDGENGEAEYGGDVESENSKGFDKEDAEKYWLSDFSIDYWKDYGFSNADLELYRGPNQQEIGSQTIERHFYSYYVDWRPQKHYYYAAENTGFRPNPEGRSQGTYSKYASLDDAIDPFHYYFAMLKFGLGRATSDAAHEIREGLISREDGVALVRRFDSEIPREETRQLFLRYAGLSESQLEASISSWRNPRLWTSTEDGVSQLRQMVS